MNMHGRHAMEMMRNHDRRSFSEIEDPETYFSNLGIQIQEQIEIEMDSLIQHDTQGRSTLEIIGERNMARVSARGMVYQEMIYRFLPMDEDLDEMEDSTPLPEERFS
ncbi:hypothetical protein [Arthrobacter glacialis]|uniref:Uncharacterized protein n=1 Tax=Arthrobacter glacialis TaxID=1664 RepID=A0A2S3ZT34_ARTGL|nr:hypothetical protein [Arthrobacter glacialis]POH72152.1 hypothetical protein CVS27_16795 [Arthrobacter glacialis]